MYRCETSKFYENHRGELKPLVLNADNTVDMDKSELADKYFDDCRILDAKWNATTNRLEYKVEYNQLTI